MNGNMSEQDVIDRKQYLDDQERDTKRVHIGENANLRTRIAELEGQLRETKTELQEVCKKVSLGYGPVVQCRLILDRLDAEKEKPDNGR